MHKWNESNILKPFNSDKIRWMYRFHVPDFMLMFFIVYAYIAIILANTFSAV